MKADDMRRALGLTWVGWLNFCVLQWAWMRLAYEVEDDGAISSWRVMRMRPMKNWNRGWWMAIPLALSLPAIALTVVVTLYLRG